MVAVGCLRPVDGSEAAAEVAAKGELLQVLPRAPAVENDPEMGELLRVLSSKELLETD